MLAIGMQDGSVYYLYKIAAEEPSMNNPTASPSSSGKEIDSTERDQGITQENFELPVKETVLAASSVAAPGCQRLDDVRRIPFYRKLTIDHSQLGRIMTILAQTLDLRLLRLAFDVDSDTFTTELCYS